MNYKPAKGDLAYCKNGELGLILEVKAYHEGDGIIRMLYSGVKVKPPYGKWQSKEPEFYGTLYDARNALDYYYKKYKNTP